MSDRRRTLGPVVLLGLASGTLAAVAATRPWVVDAAAGSTGDPVPGIDVADPVASAGEMPAALALALVLLAAWGVVLVTRGLLRRVVAGLVLAAALGLAATVVTGLLTLEDRVADAMVERGLQSDVLLTEFSAWFWVAAVAAVAALGAGVLAVAWVPQWPEMGSRYDAPGAEQPAQPEPGERTHLDLWKSMDEGHDPTA